MSAVCPAGHSSDAEDYCDVCGLPIDSSAPAPAPAPAAADPGGAGSSLSLDEPAAGGAADAADPDGTVCPNCSATNPPNALFCEACGYDFTTGSLPRQVDPAPLDLSAFGLATPGAPAEGQGAEPAEEAAASATADDPPTAETSGVAPGGAVPGAGAPIAPRLEQSWVAEVWIDPDWYAAQDNADPLPSAGVPQVIAIPRTSVLIGRESRSRGIHPGIDLGSDNGISRRHCQLSTDGTRWFVEDLGSSNGTYVGSSVGALPDQPLRAGEKREIVAGERLYLGAWTRIVIRRAQPGEV